MQTSAVNRIRLFDGMFLCNLIFKCIKLKVQCYKYVFIVCGRVAERRNARSNDTLVCTICCWCEACLICIHLCWKTEVDYSSFDERASYLLIEFKYKVIYIVRLYFLINIILRYVIYSCLFFRIYLNPDNIKFLSWTLMTSC